MLCSRRRHSTPALTTTGVGGSTPADHEPINGEGPGCASYSERRRVSAYGLPPCAFAANGMTNSTFFGSNGTRAHFLSKFLYSDIVLNNQIKTGFARLPFNLMAEFEQNLNAAASPFDTEGNRTSLGRQDKAYGSDFSVGQAITGQIRNDVQVRLLLVAHRAGCCLAPGLKATSAPPRNILQNRIYGGWRELKNVLDNTQCGLDGTLNSGLENNSALFNQQDDFQGRDSSNRC